MIDSYKGREVAGFGSLFFCFMKCYHFIFFVSDGIDLLDILTNYGFGTGPSRLCRVQTAKMEEVQDAAFAVGAVAYLLLPVAYQGYGHGGWLKRGERLFSFACPVFSFMAVLPNPVCL